MTPSIARLRRCSSLWRVRSWPVLVKMVALCVGVAAVLAALLTVLGYHYAADGTRATRTGVGSRGPGVGATECVRPGAGGQGSGAGEGKVYAVFASLA